MGMREHTQVNGKKETECSMVWDTVDNKKLSMKKKSFG